MDPGQHLVYVVSSASVTAVPNLVVLDNVLWAHSRLNNEAWVRERVTVDGGAPLTTQDMFPGCATRVPDVPGHGVHNRK
jgi:hypothetical protein